MNKHIETIIFDRKKTLNQAQTWIGAMNDREEQKAGNQIVPHANSVMAKPQTVHKENRPRFFQETFSRDPEDYEKVQEIKGALQQYAGSL